MASYWTIKDDKSDELKTIKPWEEMISNGDKLFPDPESSEQNTSNNNPTTDSLPL